MSGSVSRKLRSALLLLVGLAIAGCASLSIPGGREPSPYDPLRHGTPWEEWTPHERVHEWWYLTAVVTPQESGPQEPAAALPYLLQFTIFHLDIQPRGLYMLHLACSDYGSGRHLFEQYVSFDPGEAGGDRSAIRYGDSRIELSGSALRVHGEGRDLSMDLTAWISEAPVWHGGDGIVSMGHPDDPGENSFYYSFVRMATTGTLSLRRGSGGIVTVPVSGESWFDRQWGRFHERGWDWFSLRFFDGDRVMLFAFPATGHREATYARLDGTVSWPRGYDYAVERWVERNGKRYGLGWRLDLPIKEGRYRAVPLHEGDFNPNPANDYWEGLCRLLDEGGNLVGWCVVETTAAAHGP